MDRYLTALEHEERLRADDAVPTGAALESVALQPHFVAVAAEFGRRHRITHATWMESLVSAEVLDAAGVPSTVDSVV